MITHERNQHIDLDTDRHIYRYRGGEVFKGVTSWIGEYNEPFNAKKVARKLAQWRDQTAEEILESWERTREYGDLVHERIEAHINGEEGLTTPEVEHFKQAMEDFDLAALASEWVIYDEDIGRASAIDVTCANSDNEYVVVDVKTRKKGIETEAYKDKTMYAPLDDLPACRYYKYALQVNIYRYWLEHKYDMNVADTHYILNIHDEGYEMIPVIDLTDKVEQMYEQHD